jgi:hypothetical protein
MIEETLHSATWHSRDPDGPDYCRVTASAQCELGPGYLHPAYPKYVTLLSVSATFAMR